MTYIHSCSTIIPSFSSEKLSLAAFCPELPDLLLKVVSTVSIECHHFFPHFFHLILSLSFNISTVLDMCPVTHSREMCCSLRAHEGISLRHYQASHGLLTLSTAVVSSGHMWYEQEQSEEYPEGLESSGSCGKGLWRAGSFSINSPGQREWVWKGQYNLVNQLMATGLVPQPCVCYLDHGINFEKPGLLGLTGPSAREGEEHLQLSDTTVKEVLN